MVNFPFFGALNEKLDFTVNLIFKDFGMLRRALGSSSVGRGAHGWLRGVRRFSTPAPLVAATGEGGEDSSDAIPYTFGTFHVQNKKGDIYSVQEGGYVDLEPKELDQYFPEGLAGEMEAEFEFSGRQSWMVRDSSKLLCRILDEFKAKSAGGGGGGGGASGPVIHKAITLPSLTDRPEWVGSTMRVQYFGKDLLSPPQETIAMPKSKKTKRTAMSNSGVKNPKQADLSVVSGEGSTVDACLAKLKAASGTDIMPGKIMLVGPRGVGKSSALNQMVMHARKTGWLCLFIPRGWDQVQSGWYIEPVQGGGGATKAAGSRTTIAAAGAAVAAAAASSSSGSSSATSSAAVFDNPFMSAQVLRGFWKAHAGQLRNMPLKFPGEMAKYVSPLAKFKESFDRARSVPGREKMSFRQIREIVDAEDYFADQDKLDASVLDGQHFDLQRVMSPKNFEDLILLGVAFRDQAGLAVMDLIAELKNVTSVPVLVAVDQYNTWEVQSAFHYRMEPVAGKQLCVPHSLQFLSKRKPESEAWKLANGLCVCATSHAHAEGRAETFENSISSIPLVVRVPSYSQVEFLSAVTYYTHQNLIASGSTVHDLLAFRMLSGSSPHLTRKEAVPFFLPIAVGKLGDDLTTMALEQDDGEDGGGDDKDFDDAAEERGDRGK